MNGSEITRRVVDLLKDDSVLAEFIGVAVPQSVLMPFAGDQQKCYVMVAVFTTEQNLNRERIASICRRIVEVLQASELLNDVDGLEIMPCVVSEGQTERILRLSILSRALPRAERFAPADLEKYEPNVGMTCMLYKKGF